MVAFRLLALVFLATFAAAEKITQPAVEDPHCDANAVQSDSLLQVTGRAGKTQGMNEELVEEDEDGSDDDEDEDGSDDDEYEDGCRRKKCRDAKDDPTLCKDDARNRGYQRCGFCKCRRCKKMVGSGTNDGSCLAKFCQKPDEDDDDLVDDDDDDDDDVDDDNHCNNACQDVDREQCKGSGQTLPGCKRCKKCQCKRKCKCQRCKEKNNRGAAMIADDDVDIDDDVVDKCVCPPKVKCDKSKKMKKGKGESKKGKDGKDKSKKGKDGNDKSKKGKDGNDKSKKGKDGKDKSKKAKNGKDNSFLEKGKGCSKWCDGPRGDRGDASQ